MKISEVYKLPMIKDEDCIVDNSCRYKIDFDTSDNNCLMQIDRVANALNSFDDMYALLSKINDDSSQVNVIEIRKILAKARGEL